MSKKLIMIGLVLISITALSATQATAWLGGWGGESWLEHEWRTNSTWP